MTIGIVGTKEPLPATREEMLSRRIGKPRLTLNDYVEEIYVALWTQDGDFMRYLDAVYDEEAVEGSLSIDNSKAAECIRLYAKNNNVPIVAGKKLATIVKALNVVLRRYGMTRKQRAGGFGRDTVMLLGDAAA